METLYKTGTLNFENVVDVPVTIPTDDDLTKDVDRVKKNADKLTPGNGKVPKSAVEYIIKVQMARANTMQNPWYKFISMVSSFSTEPMNKFWKKQEDAEKGLALINETSGGVFSAIDASADNFDGSELLEEMGDYLSSENERKVSDYLKNRRDFLTSPEVFNKLFLTPLIFGHISEAQKMVENFCSVTVDVDNFIQSDHATYFARLVSLRMNLSRFLGGRYYTLAGNYGRLIQQQDRLMMYFKCHLKNHPGGHLKIRTIFPNHSAQLRLAESHKVPAPPPMPKGAPSFHRSRTSHSYLDQLGEL